MRTLTRLLLFLVLAGGWAATAIAAGPEDLRRAAAAGDVEAQHELGVLYEYGFNLPDNEAPALAWYTIAAEQGHAKAAVRRDALRARVQPAVAERAAVLASQWRPAQRQPATAPMAETLEPLARSESPAPTPEPPARTIGETSSETTGGAASTAAVIANLPADRTGNHTAGLATAVDTAAPAPAP